MPSSSPSFFSKLPRWAWFAIGGVVLLLLVGLILPVFLNVDHYRSDIVAAIEKGTGRKASIEKISARFIPSPSVVISGVKLGNPSGFPQGDLLAVEAIYGSLAWGPLFSGNIKITSLEIVRPRITLLENSQGRTNYDFSQPGASKKPEASAEGGGFQLGDIGSLKITDAEVATANVSGPNSPIKLSLRLTGLSMQLSNITLDTARMKQIEGTADLSGVKVDLSDGTPPFEFRSGKLTLKSGAASAEFRLPYAKVADVTGNLNIPDISEPVVTFEVTTPLLDLNALPSTSSDSSVPHPTPAPVTGPSKLVAHGKLAADRIRFSDYELTKANTEVKVFTDRVEISPLTAGVYGGALSITARLNRRTSPESFSASINLQNLSVEQFLAVSPKTKGKMTGTANLTLSVGGSLAPNIERTLSGPGNLEIRDGRFPGLNLGQTLGTLNKLQNALDLNFGDASGSSETTYRLISGDLNFGGARVASKLIRVDSSVGLVELSGSSGFDSTLDYRGRAKLSSSASGGGAPGVGDLVTGILGSVTKQNVSDLSVPFTLSGTFDNPKFLPGGGLPSMSTTQRTTGTTQQPAKQKSILDFLKKP